MTPSDQTLEFAHRFEKAERAGLAPLLLLHGTGGDENDLMPLGARIAPGAALLSPRGKVLENGMPRYFRRLAEGVFDLEDLKARTDDLAAFVHEARKTYALDKPIAVGFSNGANIAWSLLLRHPELLAGAILMRAMLPADPAQAPDLTGIPVLILDGEQDPLIPPGGHARLSRLLAKAGASVTTKALPTGHQLTAQDLALAQTWLASRKGA